MASTNNTEYYKLSQFKGTDKPSWIADYNEDMRRIDAGIHAAAQTGGGGGGEGGTTDFNQLSNRPKYNDEVMTGETNIPVVPVKGMISADNGGYASGGDVFNSITPINTNLTNEIANRQSADSVIRQSVTEEVTNRENAVNNLQQQIDTLEGRADVVDVVNSYSDLEEYDTSKLTAGDLIKVLEDSTHNNAISYYRWNTPEEGWNYVGSQGPFYTKAEADSAFVPQTRTVNGQALSSNIEINIPSKTSDLQNDSNFVTQSSLNSVAQNLQNSITDLQEHKQAKLVSGENIKTINGENILGSGNLPLSTSLNFMRFESTQISNFPAVSGMYIINQPNTGNQRPNIVKYEIQIGLPKGYTGGVINFYMTTGSTPTTRYGSQTLTLPPNTGTSTMYIYANAFMSVSTTNDIKNIRMIGVESPARETLQALIQVSPKKPYVEILQ